MTVEVNEQQYALFEQIMQSLTGHVVYTARVPAVVNGKTRLISQTFKADEKDQVPWGSLDAIHDVKWYPAGDPGYKADAERRHVAFCYHGYFQGIHIRSDLMEVAECAQLHYSSHAEIIGLKGVIKALKGCVAYDDEEAVRQRVQEIIDQAHEVLKQEAHITRSYDEYEEGLADEYFTHGPISELAAFERETGEKASWVQ